jgi:hypothetical protein
MSLKSSQQNTVDIFDWFWLATAVEQKISIQKELSRLFYSNAEAGRPGPVP